MLQNSDTYYSTSYLDLAVTLSFYYILEDIDKSNPKEVVFLFKNSTELVELVAAFWRRETSFEPISFADQRKNLLRRINEDR